MVTREQYDNALSKLSEGATSFPIGRHNIGDVDSYGTVVWVEWRPTDE